MKKKYAFTVMVVMIAFFVGGLLIILNSYDLGLNAANEALQKRGGGMPTEQYNNIIKYSTENYRTIGMVISVISGTAVLISSIAVYKEL